MSKPPPGQEKIPALHHPLALASFMVVVITVMLAAYFFIASTYDREFQAIGDIVVGMSVVAIGLVIWFAINLALWRASGYPLWLTALLWVSATPTALVVLVVVQMLTR